MRLATAAPGLVYFAPDPSKRELWGRWQDWPHLVTALDQGPDGVSSYWYTVVKTIGKGALRDLHLFAFWVLLLVAFSAPCGPQQDRTRRRALAESWGAMFADFGCGSCPAHDEKVQSIIDDRGGLESLHLEPGESVERGLWRTLQDQPPFSIGMPKCNLNRFFSSTQRARQELERWDSGLLNYEYLAIEESMLSKPPPKLELRPQVKDNDMGKDSTASAQAAPSAELSLKASCHNAVLVAITMLGDPDYLLYTKIILEFGAAVERWHRLQSHTLRSVAGSKAWLVSQLDSAFFKHLRDTLSCISSPASLQRCGIACGDLAGAAQRCTSPAQLAREDGLASMLVGGCMSIVSRRLRRCMYAFGGWPIRFAGLLGSEALQRRTLQAFMADRAAEGRRLQGQAHRAVAEALRLRAQLGQAVLRGVR